MHAYGPVQVRARGAARSAHGGECLAPSEHVALLDTKFMQVAVHGYQACSVVDHHRIAVEEEIARDYHQPRGGRDDGRPCVSRDIKTLMGTARLPV